MNITETFKSYYSTEMLGKLFLFGIIGGLGTVINTALLYILTAGAGLHYLLAAAFATEIAIVSNFFGNHYVTFRESENELSLWRKFLRFQAVSVVALVMTLAILWILVTLFGDQLLLVWNLVAIVITFFANFILNQKFTWYAKRAALILIVALMAISGVHAADVAAVSQLGYHPEGTKQVVVYTDDASGTFTVIDSAGSPVDTYPLLKPQNADGEQVSCQGGIPCLVGYFDDIKTEGQYHIETSSGVQSPQFKIANDVYNVDVLMEFFSATKQQGSPYHADFHSIHDPKFNYMADGSFIMESPQAAIALIRLGSAYRSNPAVFDGTIYETIEGYSNYLRGLQGLEITRLADGSGFRLNPGLSIKGAFVPGPTNLTELEVYGPGSNPSLIQTVPLTSLCGDDDGTASWDECIEEAATIYKCQKDEPCIELLYEESTGSVSSRGNGYGVARGWGYEFGCYVDIDLENGNFNDQHNPCSIFYPQENKQNTAMALHGFTQAIPAIYDVDPAKAEDLYLHAISTYEYIVEEYSDFAQGDPDTGHFGAALFLLYDYSGDVSYLKEAHSLRNKVQTTLVADSTRGNEFYWEEYVRHKSEIEANGLSYEVGGEDPVQFFRGKIYGDYKDRGLFSISNNGERVYEFDHNIQFQNSRYMLLEGIYASKTVDLYPGAEPFISEVAQSQVAWLTGKNLVQDGVSLDSPTRSYSFIMGVGNHPEDYHSRYLVDTGLSQMTAGEVIGARGTDLQFHDGTGYVYLDGKSTIMGQTLGAFGNEYNGEAPTERWDKEKTFKNGRSYIPGWINGAFDTSAESDTIFNYRDDLETYEFTESTDEMVASATELFATLDRQMNGKPRHKGVSFEEAGPILSGGIVINSTPGEVNITLDGKPSGTTDESGFLFIGDAEMGTYNLTGAKKGYEPDTEEVIVIAGTNTSVSLELSEVAENGTLELRSDPALADVGLNGKYVATTDVNGELNLSYPVGTHSILVSKDGYEPYMDSVVIEEGEVTSAYVNLSPKNSSDNITILGSSTNVSGSMFETDTAGFTVELDGTAQVTWTVDGKTVLTETGNESTLSWNPGPLYTSNSKTAVVTASIPGDSETWSVDVEYVVNPFFTSTDGGNDIVGSPDTQVHIFTNDHANIFTSMEVTMKSQEGTSVHQMTAFPNEAEEEVDWRVNLLDVPEGDNYIFQALGKNNQSNDSTLFVFGEVRAHHRTIENDNDDDDDDDDDRGGSRGGSGGGAVIEREIVPELVYAVFDEDVVDAEGSQTVRLDASVGVGGNITAIEVEIANPAGIMRDLELEIVSGTHTYGTWSRGFEHFRTGQHTLSNVHIYNNGEKHTFNVSGVSFYVVSDSVAQDEELGLVYTALNASRVKNGSTVLFTMDARDSRGIESINVRVESSRGGNLTIPLEMISGDELYGTWQGEILAEEPDTTLTFTEVTLSNGIDEKTYPLSARSVYVEALPIDQSLAGITGNVVSGISLYSQKGVEQLLREPLVPTMVAFAIMVLTMATVLVSHKLKSKLER